MTVTFDTYKALDNQWRSARQVHDRVGCWALPSIRHALSTLAAKELIDEKSAAHPSGEIIHYRLIAQDTKKVRPSR